MSCGTEINKIVSLIEESYLVSLRKSDMFYFLINVHEISLARL
jgi:hypothetical protein